MKIPLPLISLKLKIFFGFLIFSFLYSHFSSVNFVCSSGIIVPSETICIFQKPAQSTSNVSTEISFEYAYKKSHDFMREAIIYASKTNNGYVSISDGAMGILGDNLFPQFTPGTIYGGVDAGDKLEIWTEYRYYMCYSPKCPAGYMCEDSIFCEPKTTYGHFFISKRTGQFVG